MRGTSTLIKQALTCAEAIVGCNNTNTVAAAAAASDFCKRMLNVGEGMRSAG